MKYRISYKDPTTKEVRLSGYFDNKRNAKLTIKAYESAYEDCKIIESEG